MAPAQCAYPPIARLAENYLASRASSAASERVIVAAGNVVTEERNTLGDVAIDALVFLGGSYEKRNLAGGARQEGQ